MRTLFFVTALAVILPACVAQPTVSASFSANYSRVEYFRTDNQTTTGMWHTDFSNKMERDDWSNGTYSETSLTYYKNHTRYHITDNGGACHYETFPGQMFDWFAWTQNATATGTCQSDSQTGKQWTSKFHEYTHILCANGNIPLQDAFDSHGGVMGEETTYLSFVPFAPPPVTFSLPAVCWTT